MRQHQLAKHPYCQCPMHKGQDKSAIAAVVDHIDPHRGDRRKFFDARNVQSLTKRCHDSLKQEQERSGSFRGCDTQGNPIDQRSHWWST